MDWKGLDWNEIGKVEEVGILEWKKNNEFVLSQVDGSLRERKGINSGVHDRSESSRREIQKIEIACSLKIP